MTLAEAFRILAQRPPAKRPAWTCAQWTVLWHQVWRKGGDEMRDWYLRAQPDGDSGDAGSDEPDAEESGALEP